MAGILVIANAEKFDHLPPKVRELIQDTAIKYEKITMDKVEAEQKETKEKLDKAGQQAIVLKGEQAKNYIDAYMKTPWGRMKANPNIHINVDELKRDWF